MYCIIQTGGKQLEVCKNQIIKVEYIQVTDPENYITFNEVLAVNDGEQILLGSPLLENYQVIGQLIKEQKDPKIIVFKKKKRKNYCRKNGHRQLQTVIKIIDIIKKES